HAASASVALCAQWSWSFGNCRPRCSAKTSESRPIISTSVVMGGKSWAGSHGREGHLMAAEHGGKRRDPSGPCKGEQGAGVTLLLLDSADAASKIGKLNQLTGAAMRRLVLTLALAAALAGPALAQDEEASLAYPNVAFTFAAQYVAEDAGL